MKRTILFFFGIFLFCGCTTTSNSVSVEAAGIDGQKSQKTLTVPNSSPKPLMSTRKSVSGTFCGDKDVSDDF